MVIAAQHHLGAESCFVEGVFLLEEEGVRRQVSRRRQPVQCAAERDQCDIKFAPGNLVERGKPLGNQVRVGRESIVGQRFPVGEGAHAQIGRKPAHLLGNSLCIPGAGADHHQGAAALRQLGEVERIGSPGETRLMAFLTLRGDGLGKQHEKD